MELLASKWSMACVILLIVFLVLYVVGRKSVHHEVIVDATPDVVWSVLMDVATYPEWNPVMEVMTGELEEGNEITYLFAENENKRYEIKSRVKKIVEREILNQGGGLALVLSFDHRYELHEVSEGTMVVIHEEYRGVGVPFWNPGPVEEAYGRLNYAIKQRSELLYQR